MSQIVVQKLTSLLRSTACALMVSEAAAVGSDLDFAAISWTLGRLDDNSVRRAKNFYVGLRHGMAEREFLDIIPLDAKASSEIIETRSKPSLLEAAETDAEKLTSYIIQPKWTRPQGRFHMTRSILLGRGDPIVLNAYFTTNTHKLAWKELIVPYMPHRVGLRPRSEIAKKS